MMAKDPPRRYQKPAEVARHGAVSQGQAATGESPASRSFRVSLSVVDSLASHGPRFIALTIGAFAVISWPFIRNPMLFLAAHHQGSGNDLRDKGKLDEAMAEYRKAVEIYPDCAPLHYSLAQALLDKGQWDESIAENRKALELDRRPHRLVGKSTVRRRVPPRHRRRHEGKAAVGRGDHGVPQGRRTEAR